MSKKINKFDALAYAVAVLGHPHEISKDEGFEVLHGFVSDAHWWALPEGRHWLAVHEWSDGNQITNAGAAGTAYTIGVRNNADGSLRPEYEAQARALIDDYAEAANE